MKAFAEFFRGLRVVGRIWSMARESRYYIRRPKLADRQR